MKQEKNKSKGKKLAIIGASYLQLPLIEKAKEMGLETHVFAWAAGDVGESAADYFYPISITEKEEILAKCESIKIDGICSIASDLAVHAVNHVGTALGLTSNTVESAELSTNKWMMRAAFEKRGDPSPKSISVSSCEDIKNIDLKYPIIIKPSDRSGSRGITKLNDKTGLSRAIEAAIGESFEKRALVEEFVGGQEYSVEYVSWEGEHYFLALTQKFTTGSPHFIEKGHIEPAIVDEQTLSKIKKVVSHALDTLHIRYGASHSEIKITDDGTLKLIEIGSRMGGDFIGSNLVEMSTGIDFVKAVIDIALGIKPDLKPHQESHAAGVKFIFDEHDLSIMERLKAEHPEYITYMEIDGDMSCKVTDSSNRHGYYLMMTDDPRKIEEYI